MVNFGQNGGGRGPILVNFGPGSRPLWAPGQPISAIFGASNQEKLTRPIWVDTGAPKCTFFVKLEAVGGPVLVHFGPPSQLLWAPGWLIFANFGHCWVAKTPDFGQTWNANSGHFVRHRGAKMVSSGQIRGGRGANFGYFGPPSRPFWALGRPIFINYCHFWGAKTPDFGQTWNTNWTHLG